MHNLSVHELACANLGYPKVLPYMKVENAREPALTVSLMYNLFSTS